MFHFDTICLKTSNKSLFMYFNFYCIYKIKVSSCGHQQSLSDRECRAISMFHQSPLFACMLKNRKCLSVHRVSWRPRIAPLCVVLFIWFRPSKDAVCFWDKRQTGWVVTPCERLEKSIHRVQNGTLFPIEWTTLTRAWTHPIPYRVNYFDQSLDAPYSLYSELLLTRDLWKLVKSSALYRE
jgi:hypothetical protein